MILKLENYCSANNVFEKKKGFVVKLWIFLWPLIKMVIIERYGKKYHLKSSQKNDNVFSKCKYWKIEGI